MFERRTETDGFVCRIAASFNKALQVTANPLRFLAATDPCRYPD